MIEARRSAPFIPFCVAVLLAAGARAEWRLWPDFVAGSELHLDQSQSIGTSNALAFERGSKGIGQTFRPAAPLLHRIDVQVRNLGDERPARIRLWKWRGSQRETEKSPPIFQDSIGMAGVRHSWHTRSTFPDARVEVGAPYYFRLDAEQRDDFEVRANRGADDAYPPGRLVAAHLPDQQSADLWFRTWTRGQPGADPEGAPPASQGLREETIHWSPPDRAPGAVEAADYLRRIDLHARWLRDSESASCGANDDRRALVEAYLHRISCEAKSCRDELARNAIRRLGRFLDWQHCDFPGEEQASCRQACRAAKFDHFPMLDAAIDAYAVLRDSAAWDARTGARLEELFASRADELWPRRQLGTSSNALVAASVLLRLAELVPDRPNARLWRSYAEAIWAGFRRDLDFEEVSAHYAARIAWPAVLQLAEATGESDALWSEPRFRELVDRFFFQVAPLGVLPSYGDATGWGTDSPGLIWLFEEASQHTGDGRYRWLAHQIFRYNREHARSERPEGDNWEPKMHHLARAYLAARNGPGAPERPAPLSEAPAESPARDPDVWWTVDADHAVGQTFVHPGGSLARIDVRIEAADAVDARMRIWEWRGDLRATKRRDPLHSARLTPGSGGIFSAHPIFPRPDSASYYFEIGAAQGSLRVGGFADDAYPRGRAFGPARAPSADLWFATRALRGFGSIVTQRLASEERPVSKWSRPIRVYASTGRRVPDTLVLRSGSDPDDLFALVNLTSGYGHGHPSLAGFAALIDGESVILSETSFPYWLYARRPEEENVAMVRRHRGGTAQPPGRSVEIARFRDTPNLTVAWLRFRDTEGFGVAQERRVYFLKNRLVWVRDRFDVPAGMLATVGTVWHPDVLVPPEAAGGGYRIAYPHPLDSVWPLHNPPRFARLWLPEHAATVEAHELMPEHAASPRCRRLVAHSGPLPAECRVAPAYALHRSWTGQSDTERSVWIDTVIVPEAPEESSRLLRLPAQGRAVALELSVRDERWILVDNPDREPLRVGGLETDALYAFLRVASDAAPYLYAEEATRLDGFGLALDSETPSSTERGGLP